jgi:hypothetical protein
VGGGEQVVALGSQGRYYVAFEDGTMEFEGGGNSDFHEVVSGEAAAVVAFGEHETSYFAMLASGEFFWCNVPPALDKLLNDNSITKNIHRWEPLSLSLSLSVSLFTSRTRRSEAHSASPQGAVRVSRPC